MDLKATRLPMGIFVVFFVSALVGLYLHTASQVRRDGRITTWVSIDRDLYSGTYDREWVPIALATLVCLMAAGVVAVVLMKRAGCVLVVGVVFPALVINGWLSFTSLLDGGHWVRSETQTEDFRVVIVNEVKHDSPVGRYFICAAQTEASSGACYFLKQTVTNHPWYRFKKTDQANKLEIWDGIDLVYEFDPQSSNPLLCVSPWPEKCMSD